MSPLSTVGLYRYAVVLASALGMNSSAENRFRCKGGLTSLCTSQALPFAAARRDERGEPAVRNRAAAAVPASRYEVILVSPGARRRLRGRRRIAPSRAAVLAARHA